VPSNSRSRCSGFIRLKYFSTSGLPTIWSSCTHVRASRMNAVSQRSYSRKGLVSFFTNLSFKVWAIASCFYGSFLWYCSHLAVPSSPLAIAARSSRSLSRSLQNLGLGLWTDNPWGLGSNWSGWVFSAKSVWPNLSTTPGSVSLNTIGFG